MKRRRTKLIAWLMTLMMIFTSTQVSFATDGIKDPSEAEPKQATEEPKQATEEPKASGESQLTEPAVDQPKKEECAHKDGDSNGFCDDCGEYIGKEKTYTLPVRLVIPEDGKVSFYTGKEGKGNPIKAEDKGMEGKLSHVPAGDSSR